MKKWLIAAGVCAFLASPSAYAAADMSCAGKNFVFFPGGPEGGAFASIVYAGAKAAADQTGCHVDYVWSDWNPQKMVQQFSEADRPQADRHLHHGPSRRRGARPADRSG